MTPPMLLLFFDLSGAVLTWLVAAAFGLLGLLCVVLAVIGLPGLWVLLLLAGLVQLSDRWLRPEGPHTFAAETLIGAVVLAIVAEVLEFAAGAAGAKRAGASKRGMLGAMIGGIAGAIFGAPFGLLIGSVIGGVLGSAIGAILGELSLPHQTLERSLKPAAGAAMGRLKGLAAKLVITCVIWIGLTVAAIVT